MSQITNKALLTCGSSTFPCCAIPDALAFALSTLASQPLITVTPQSGAVDIFVTDLAAAPAIWSDGVFLTVTLRAN